ncbi:MAG: hypothetical protein KF703_01340 [Actinobacteria bacterium]|nr:hypothetical protein [Actinomycetota bacterium]
MIAWACAATTNNTVRGRIAVAVAFFTWCQQHGYGSIDLARVQGLKRRYPRVYGRAQAANPARWLTYDEAFNRLIPACQDGTDLGIRDELVIRFGLAGVRRSEIVTMTWRNLAALPAVEWIGKGNRPRRIVIGPAFLAVLDRWHAAYPDPHPDAPVICRTGGTVRPFVDWGQPYRSDTNCIHKIVTRRAATAGLGHVAPMTCDAPLPASSTTPPTTAAPTTSTCSTFRGCSATPTPPRPCAPTSTRWTPASSTAPHRTSTSSSREHRRRAEGQCGYAASALRLALGAVSVRDAVEVADHQYSALASRAASASSHRS